MGKKIIITIMACMFALSLAACGNSLDSTTTAAAGDSTTQASQSAATGDTTGKGYVFTYNGNEIYAGEDASIIDSLGDYKDYSESQSCAFEGLDKQYFYGSFYVTTGTLDGKEFIANYWFVDDTVETDEGLCIGDTKDKVESIYGADGFNGTNAYIYTKDNCELTIILDGDTVSSIQYAYKY